MKENLPELRSHRIHVLLVIVLGVIVYSNTFDVPFVFDDFLYIVNNDAIRDFRYFIEPAKATKIISSDTLVGYTFKNRIIGYLTFALNYKLQGIDVTGYHVVNIIIHVINALFVYYLVMLTFKTPFFKVHNKKVQSSLLMAHSNNEPSMSYELIALFSALFFVSHSIQTQAITYISQRFASLATMFYLGSLVMYIKFRLKAIGSRTEVIGNRIIAYRLSPFAYYLLSLLFAVLAMKTKEIAFTLPIIITVYEFMFFGETFKRRMLYLMPILLTVLIIPMSLIDMNKPIGDLIAGVDALTRAKAVMSRWDYFFTELRVMVTYIRLLFFPVNQNLDYDYPIYRSFLNPEVYLSFLFLLSIFGLGVYLFYRSRFKKVHSSSFIAHSNPPSSPVIKAVTRNALRVTSHEILRGEQRGGNSQAMSHEPRAMNYERLISFGIFWFFITLSVESSIIPTQDVIFEHRVYLPSVGFFIVFSTIIFYVLRFINSKLLFTAYCLLPTIIIILSVAAYNRNNVWKDDIVLWKDVIKKSPKKARPYHELGLAYFNRGMLDKAIPEFETAVRLSPDYVMAHNNLSVVYFKLRMFDEAIREIQITLMLSGTENAEAYGNIGAIYLLKGLTDKAIEYLEHALELNPDHASAHHNLGIAYKRKGLNDKAAGHSDKAHMLAPEKYPED